MGSGRLEGRELALGQAVAGPGFWDWVFKMYRDIQKITTKMLIFSM